MCAPGLDAVAACLHLADACVKVPRGHGSSIAQAASAEAGYEA